MDIDEFIEHTKEKAREHRYHADFFESDNPMNTACIKSAEDCEQLAGWLKKAEEYQQLEERLNKVYGDCDGLLLRVVEMLEKHPCIDMANNTLKSRLLTDEDVDKWEEYKQLEEQGRLVKLPCKIGDDVWFVPSQTNYKLNILNKHSEANRVYHQKVAKITFSENGWYLECDKDLEYATDHILIDKMYKETWFLTKSEAEARLKELRGGENE